MSSSQLILGAGLIKIQNTFFPSCRIMINRPTTAIRPRVQRLSLEYYISVRGRSPFRTKTSFPFSLQYSTGRFARMCRREHSETSPNGHLPTVESHFSGTRVRYLEVSLYIWFSFLPDWLLLIFTFLVNYTVNIYYYYVQFT